MVFVGVVNVFIIYYFVEWWNILYQGVIISKFDKLLIVLEMFWLLFIVLFGFVLFIVVVIVMCMKNEIICREYYCFWVKEMVQSVKEINYVV